MEESGDRKMGDKPLATWLERFRARAVRDLRSLELRNRLGEPPAPLRMAVVVFTLVILLAGLAFALGLTGGSWLLLVVAGIGLFGIAAAVGSALAVTEYRHLQDLDRARHELLALHAETEVLREGQESRLHDARAVLGAMGAAVHALERSEVSPAIAAALGEETERLRQILTATPLTLARVPAVVVCGSVASFARLREVPLIIDVAPETMLMVDPTGIAQVLRNLVDNARKYAPGSAVRISCEPAGPYVRLTIDDDGPGIDPAAAETLFESGIRSGGSAQGSGKGLAVARRLAESMGGSLWYEARPEQGARFVLKLQRAEERPAPPSVAPEERG